MSGESGSAWPEVLVRVAPTLTASNEFFWTGGKDGILRILSCEDCGALIHPPSPVCPACLGRNVSPRELSGRATIYSFTVNEQPWVPEQQPYTVAIVELEEDPSVRLTTNIVRCDPDDVEIGMEVEVEFVEWQEFFLPCFRPRAR